MTDKTDLIREIHEYVTAHGGENTATHLLVQAASAIQTQAAELEAVGAGGVQALSAAPAGFVPVAAFDRLHAHAESLAARLLAASPTPPAEQQAEESLTKLLAECRCAFPVPEPGSPLEVQWAAAMARPEEVPEYVRMCVASMQAAPKAAPVVWLSSKQLRGITALHGQYLPFRQQPEGRFDTPVYLEESAPKAAPGEQNTVPAEWLEQAYREGWAACRDAETIGEESEDWAFGNSTANSRMIDAQQVAPKAAPGDGWLQSGALLYRLTDDRKPRNRDEIRVTMADGSHTSEACARRAGELLDRIRAPQQEAQEPCPSCRNSDIYACTCPFPTSRNAAPQPAPALLSGDVVRDAARYVALRDGSIAHDDILETVKDPGKWEQPYAVLLRGTALDSAIDAALASQGGRA